MTLDQLLATMSIDQLQDLAVVWSPDEPLSNSKLALFRVLRAAMTRPDRARHCLELADPLGRSVVRKLLRSENVSQSVAALAASSAPRAKSIQDARSVVAELASMGLVCVEAEKRWEPYGSARVILPDELVEPLRLATGIDRRTAPQILNLADHLATLGRAELSRTLKTLGMPGDARTPVPGLVALLAAPADCARRLDNLGADLRGLALTALRERAGIVSVDHLLRELRLELPEIRDAAVAGWRNDLEANLIGTVGDLSLLEYGIDLDGKMLVLFTEVAEALLSRPLGSPRTVADPVGPDFLVDLSELVSAVRESGARLKATGALTGAASQRILAKLNRPTLPLMDPQDLLEFRVLCAEKLGLVDRSGDSLTVRESAWEWEQRSYEEKAADLFNLVGFAAPAPRSKHHHEALCEIARDRLRRLEPGQWLAAGSLAHTTLRAYLGSLGSTGLRQTIADAVHQVDEFVLPPFPGLRQLGADLRESVVVEAFALGVLDLETDGKEHLAESLSEFGAAAAGRKTERPPARLIATPDFEVIILPEGDTTRLRYEIGQFAAREKLEQTYHLRITKERVEDAVARGLRAGEMVRLLADHSESRSVPQNVEYSIRGWADRIRIATVENVHVLELSDEKLLNVVAELPGVKELIVRRISPTCLALSSWPADRGLLADLRRLGIHVR